MPRFPDYIIQEVADKNDIYDVISKSVHLKKAGSSYIGLCPFHHEKTPSFSVSPRRGIFKCFGCGVGGDVIRFVMKNEDLSFHDAVVKLAERANIALPKSSYEENDNYKRRKRHDELMLEINMHAAEFFYSCVSGSRQAVEYFKKRNIDGKTVKYFWLGYAPDKWTALVDYLKEKGYDEADIYDCSLAKKRDDGSLYDTFRNRIMFTIFDVNNNVIGFGGRVLDDSKPKYLNSADSNIFNKRKNLYGLNIARHSKKDFVILCEGYMDAIALVKSGYDNAVATLGTALTDMQARIIARYFKEVVICYDSDSAGRAATNRAISILRGVNIKISVVYLKGAKDPDEYIESYGKTRFDAEVRNRKKDMLYLIDYFGGNYDLKNYDDVISYISELTEYLRLIKNDVELDVCAGIISERTGVQKASILSQTGLKRAETVSDALVGTNADAINVINKKYSVSDTGEYLEKTCALLLGTLFYEKRLYDKYKSKLSEDMFTLPIHKTIFKYIKDCFENGGETSNTALISMLNTEDDINEATSILALDAQSEDTDKAVSDYINQINQKSGPQRAMELLKQNKITLEEFNDIINNKG